MKKAALYVRVSTTHQIDKDSLPFQRQELTNYAKYVLGIDDFEIFEDAGYSGKNTERPRYQEMMARIKVGEFSHLLVWKIDRISRNIRDFSEMYDEIKSKNVAFVSKNEQFDTSSAMGEAMLKIILVFAELERKLAGERVFSIMLSRAEKGLWNGATVPLGYNWSDEEKFPVMDEEEAKIVKYIYDLYEKTSSCSQVAYRLNAEQVQTKRGGKWTAKTISDILRNPFYIGTYRYNVKDGKRRWKDEKEWVVVEDNHPGFISKEQFEIVNAILTENFRGDTSKQRRNSNIHVFAKMLTCGKCGANLVAGLDAVRSDGYRPSRYYCSSNRFVDNYHNCNNFVSDTTMLPFALNYISNFINLQNSITRKHSLRDIERTLLRGRHFVDVECIDRKGLEDTYLAFVGGFSDQEYNGSEEEIASVNMELESLKREKKKYEQALERLEDLFLFASEAMSKKDFLFKKRDLVKNLERINDELAALHKRDADMKMTTDIAFLNKASHFLMSQELSKNRDLDFRELLQLVDKTVIKDFVQEVIEKIVIVDKRIHSITFRNGISHEFLYKPKELQKNRPKQKFLYRSYEPMLLEHLKKHGSVSRKEVEELIGMGRTGAGSLIREFIAKGYVEKKGNSTAIRYFFIEKKTT